ncbi:MAG: energy-coupling factor transporter transmembrane component T [Oscillospiraceae bacterium]|nr:energy-coupling factor transporter transmembrane component T [Oscillospiraceae bacterium]
MKETYLHRLNVTTKLFCFLCVIIAVFLFNHPLPNLLLALVLLALVLPSGLDMRTVFKTLRSLTLIIVIIIVMTTFTAQPDKFHLASSSAVLFTLWGAKATLGGLLQGLTFMLRIFLMVFATCAFTMSTPIDDLLSFFNKIKASYELSIVVATAISFVPTMMQNKDMIFQAQKARGAGISQKGAFNQLKAFVPIMIPLVTNSILMADNLSISMTNRGYGANRAWTDLSEKHMEPRDYVIIAAAALFTAGCIALRAVWKIGMI